MGYWLNGKEPVLTNNKEWVTSSYGYRVDPVTGKPGTYHGGIDLVDGKSWSPVLVLALASGVVETVVNNVTWSFAATRSIRGVSSSLYNGNYVVIKHEGGYKTTYKHLKLGGIVVKVGDKVAKGAPLGMMGTTGYSTGVHLHFEIALNGTRQDPAPYLLGKKVVPAPPQPLVRPTVTQVRAAVDKLAAAGIVNTAEYWYKNYTKLADIDWLLTKSAAALKGVGLPSLTVDQGLAKLVAAKVINTPTYWKKHYTEVPFLDELIKRLGGAV